MIRQDRFEFETSYELDSVVRKWLEENRPLPADLLERLRKNLLKNGYEKAANSLKPKLVYVRSELDSNYKLRFYAEWEILSFKTPLARRTINNFCRRHGFGHKEFQPDIEIVLLNGLETKNGHYAFYFCLPQEIETIKKW